MKIKYLNYSQADAISADYQHLIGRPFEQEEVENRTVKQVLVAPYSRILQWQFLRLLQQGVCPEEALSICPNGRFDVLVLPTGSMTATLGPKAKTLRNYLQEQEIAFNPDTYNFLRTT